VEGVIVEMEGDEGFQLIVRTLDTLQRLISFLQQFVHVRLDQVEQEFLLCGDMIVKRAGLDADFGGKVAQAHRLVPVLVDQAKPDPADRLHGSGTMRPNGTRHKAASSLNLDTLSNITTIYERLFNLTPSEGTQSTGVHSFVQS